MKEDITLSRAELAEALRTALMQLDDISSLRHSPLLPFLCPNASSPLALQQVLVNAIEAVEQMDEPFAVEAYEILYYRYVERLTQQQLAYQLGMSVRHLRRQQENALEFLLNYVVEELLPTLSTRQTHLSDPSASNSVGAELARTTALAGEIAWLQSGFEADAADLGEALAKALHDVEVLARHHGVTLRLPSSVSPTLVTIPAPVLCQALLTLLSWAVARTTGGTLVPAWQIMGYHASVTVDAEVAREIEELTIAEQLVAPFGGQVQQVSKPSGGMQVEMRLPRVGMVPILFLDDNPDMRQLFQRYTARSRFQLIATDDSRAVVEVAQRHQVQAIVLDIMMPRVDGWDLLAQLQHHPATQAIPVIICTILPQRQLAHLLGAAAFLLKPVNQSDLLSALDQITTLRTTAPL